MTALYTLAAATIGGLLAGAVNRAVFQREHRAQLFSKKEQKCRVCLEPIHAIDRIPILSYLHLKGRCRTCSSVIPWHYPAIEMGFTVLSVALFWRAFLGFGIMGGAAESLWLAIYVRDLIIAAFFLVIFVYDARFRVILDEYSIPLLLFIVMSGLLLGQPIEFIGFGAIAYGGFFALLSLATQGHFAGGGDIRLALGVGAYLGLFGGFVAILGGYVLAAIFGLGLVLSKREKLNDAVPLGSFLVLGTFLSLFLAPEIIVWYVNLW